MNRDVGSARRPMWLPVNQPYSEFVYGSQLCQVDRMVKASRSISNLWQDSEGHRSLQRGRVVAIHTSPSYRLQYMVDWTTLTGEDTLYRIVPYTRVLGRKSFEVFLFRKSTVSDRYEFKGDYEEGPNAICLFNRFVFRSLFVLRRFRFRTRRGGYH